MAEEINNYVMHYGELIHKEKIKNMAMNAPCYSDAKAFMISMLVHGIKYNMPEMFVMVDEINRHFNCAPFFNGNLPVSENYMPKFEVDPSSYFEFVNLDFFTDSLFGTLAGQQKFRRIVNDVLPRMDEDSGRDWVAPYIAYHYYINKQLILKRFGKFFADIDKLLPGKLTKQIDNSNIDKRYKTYIDMLQRECKNWFIENNCLPAQQEWTDKKYDNYVGKDRRARIQQIVREIYLGLKSA